MDLERRNIVAGLLLIATGLFFGAFMSAARDFESIERWLRRPPVRSNQVMYAHAHLGVIGLTNIALGLVLPLASMTARRRTAISWTAVASGVLVPAGMILSLLPEPWEKLVYLQAGGFLLLLFATVGTAWSLRRAA